MVASMDAQWTPGKTVVSAMRINKNMMLGGDVSISFVHIAETTVFPGVHWASTEATIGRPLDDRWATIADATQAT